MDLSSPKIEISNQLRARCCRRVAQFEPHITSEKEYYIYIYTLSVYIDQSNQCCPCMYSFAHMYMYACTHVCTHVCVYSIYTHINRHVLASSWRTERRVSLDDRWGLAPRAEEPKN